MKGYGMGNKDHMADRAARLAARYPDRVPKEPSTHVEVDGELFVFGDQAVEAVDVPDEPETESVDDGVDTTAPDEPWDEDFAKSYVEQAKRKGGRPKGSKNKAKD